MGIWDTYLKRKNDAKNFLSEYGEETGLLGEIQNIAKILGYLLTPIGVGLLIIVNLTPGKVQLVLILLNLIVLFIWLGLMWKPKLRFHDIIFKDEKSKEGYRTFLQLISGTDVDINNDRVNKLVGQLKFCIKGYVICLLIVYGAFFLHNECLWQWSQCDVPNNPNFKTAISAEWHYFLKILEDSFNLISAAFIYLGFKVLYNRTLDKNNNRNFYSLTAIVVCILVIFPYLYHMHFIIASPSNNNLPHETITNIRTVANNYVNKINNFAPNTIANINNISNSNREPFNKMNEIKQIAANYNSQINQMATNEMKEEFKNYEGDTSTKCTNIFGLIIGSLNGLAMALLFGRYISMEHLINNLEKKIVYNRFSIGVIFLLPMYALAQPLFGAFDINAFGDPKIFANCVFFICLLGKAFFLYFTYKFIEKRKLHYYLHLVITSHDIMKNFKTYFADKPLNID
ncbi:MAG: hypothetical protein WA584_06010 [Pyrinomonadaceae bacterium]